MLAVLAAASLSWGTNATSAPSGVVSQGFESDRPRFLWSPGETANVRLNLNNSTPAAMAFDLTVALQDDSTTPIWTRPMHVTLSARGVTTVPVAVATSGLKQGVYLLEFKSAETAVGFTARALLTVADVAALPKAKDDEFWYGMDIASLYSDKTRLDWADWCGVDVVRNYARDFVRKGDDLGDIAAAVAALKDRGLRGQLMLDPLMPFDPDPEKFDAIVARRAAVAGRIAATFKGQIRWYEIGNEPDQYFFFHGGADNYVKMFTAVRNAIKAADPEAIVSNGGLCFHNNYGETVGHEIVKRMPPELVDAWAYHAHGEGSAAERHIFDTLTQAIDSAGDLHRPIVDTESGFACDEPVGYRVQARTVVQKIVFAESQARVKMFLWFGFHPKWVFGLLETPEQARPGALAYRVMVQRTRGLSAKGAMDLKGAPGEAYLFQRGAKSTIVLWSNGNEFTRSIDLGPQASHATLYDLFGNATTLAINGQHCVQVSVGTDPEYLSVDLSESAVPTIARPALEVPATLRVVPGGSASIPITLHNAGNEPKDLEVRMTPQGDVPLQPCSSLAMRVDPRGETSITLPTQVADAAADWWPKYWSIFAPVNSEIDLTTYSAQPATLIAGGQILQPLVGVMQDGGLNLRDLTGGFAEKRQGILFATVDVPNDIDTTIGAAADFWMDWYVNGQPIYDTLKTGNGPMMNLLSHTFTAHFKKGKNLIAVRVLSGSSSWIFNSGGPRIIAAMQRQKAGASDGALIELRDGDNLLARELVRVEVLAPVVGEGDNHAAHQRPPDAVLGPVENYFVKAPDQTRWYQGAVDLSGQMWVEKTAAGLMQIIVAVRDDVATPGDACRADIAWGNRWSSRAKIDSHSPGVAVHREAPSGITQYTLALPPEVMAIPPRQKIAIRVTVDDDDFGVLKQRACTARTDDPDDWYQTFFDLQK